MVGYLVTSVRHDPVWAASLMPVYRAIEETGLPLGFHAGPTWDDQWMRTMNKFVSMHAISFVHANIVHLTNWIMNGLPEKFPRLKVIWIESGLAWVPFLMQRLDSEYLKRSSEAPLLTRRPSEYMRDMFYTSQPMERDDFMLLESTFRAIDAGSQLMYASDWPHWDFDLPSSILELPFLTEQEKRNILGENARKLFSLGA
ncbi:amidohydrolase family protein [Amycolatopsis jejuensis]|uniref:amidohydrolase family protein n=1 Tax=Amycolatopsis jejuensis TaxID=330084 RepID=UPI00068A3D3D|nr:amidohydrolase family protein [Amycolatopsis jejuensis]